MTSDVKPITQILGNLFHDRPASGKDLPSGKTPQGSYRGVYNGTCRPGAIIQAEFIGV